MQFDVYCDESRQDKFWNKKAPEGRSFVLLGGVWLPTERRAELKAGISGLRSKHNLHGEFKWTRVSPSRLQFYLDLVKLFFESEARFRCIVLPVEKLDCIQFHQGDLELMFYKFYYQLIKHWLMDGNGYNIFLDTKSNRRGERLPDLKRVLQNSNYLATINNVQALPSSEVSLIQLADVLIGAVGYKFHRQTSSPSKMEVVKAIESFLPQEIKPTFKTERKFNVFHWLPGRQW